MIIDNETMQIIGVEATADAINDCEVFEQLVDELPNKVNKVLGDGDYDTLDPSSGLEYEWNWLFTKVRG